MIERADVAETGVVTARVFVRASSWCDPVHATLRRLQRLDREGLLTDLRVQVWPAAVRRSPEAVETTVDEYYAQFAAWADREGKAIEPAFEVCPRHSRFTGESHEVLRPPMLCLALYEDDRLGAVFPHTDGDGVHTVADAVDALVDGDIPLLADDWSGSLPDGTCPACGGTVVDVQGLLACHDCDWVAAHPVARSRRVLHHPGRPLTTSGTG